EALEVADRIVIMNEGRIEQVGSPTELHDHPESAFVEGFLGDVNLLEGEVGADGAVTVGALRIPAPEATSGANVRVTVHAGAIDVKADTDGNATVVRTADLGERAQLEVAVDGG